MFETHPLLLLVTLGCFNIVTVFKIVYTHRWFAYKMVIFGSYVSLPEGHIPVVPALPFHSIHCVQIMAWTAQNNWLHPIYDTISYYHIISYYIHYIHYIHYIQLYIYTLLYTIIPHYSIIYSIISIFICWLGYSRLLLVMFPNNNSNHMSNW